MKRLVTYCLLAVILLMGVTATSVCSTQKFLMTASSITLKQSLPDRHQSSFTAMDLPISVGATSNEQVRLSNPAQHISFRVLPAFSNMFRINRSVQIAQQQFLSGYTGFLLKSAFKQSDGYYLYHLRKLLI